MNEFYDYQKFAILYVDDEERALRQLPLAFAGKFRFLTAPNAAEGLRILEERKSEIAVLMSDERMPGERGVRLLEKARQIEPRVIRILVTAYTDFEAAITAVNSGAIYKYISKPWEMDDLEQVLRRAIEFFLVQRERDQLLREKMAALHKTVIMDRMVSLGIVAAGLSHHVRNSLVAIRTFIDLAPAKLEGENLQLDRLRDPHYWKEFYGQARAQMERITGMLGDLQLVTEHAPHPADSSAQVSASLDTAARLLQPRLERKQITLLNQLPPGLPPLPMDPVELERVFDLLLQDEIASLPPGSAITVQARVAPGGRASDDALQIEVQDNGPGLPEDQLRSVFDPFFIRIDNPQEFGIRLLACYFMVYHHGGRMDVRSAPGQGTTFQLTLPLNPAVSAAPAGPAADQEFLAKVMANDALWEKLLAGN